MEKKNEKPEMVFLKLGDRKPQEFKLVEAVALLRKQDEKSMTKRYVLDDKNYKYVNKELIKAGK